MLLLCLKICFARILDVSLGTVKMLYVVKGNKIFATLIAFAEVLIWFFAAREALNTEVESLWIAVSYALGYAAGTFIGTTIDQLFITGIYSIEVISDKISSDDITKIKQNNFGVSVVETVDGKTMLFLSINKKRYKECLRLIKSIDPKSFIIINDSKIAYNGYIKKK